MPTPAMSRTAKRPANRRAWAQRSLTAARREDVVRLTAAYDWFRAELAVFTAAGGDTKPAAWLTDTIWKAAARLNTINEEMGHGREL